MIIAHLADLHIRLSHRHEEYREVFKRLYVNLRDNKVELIVIAGDLFHSKTTLSPEAVELLAEFLKELSNIAPVVVLPGNHDLNLSNADRLDSLSPVIKLLNSSNDLLNKIVYYDKTGIYDYSDRIVFGVWSCIDGYNPPVLKKESKDPNKTYIALYHGIVTGSKLDNDYEVKDSGVGISIFANYDIVMLGDLHSYQTVHKNNRIVYPGSLIQQSFGEDIDHGYVIWNIDTFQHKRELIYNDYCYVNLFISDKELPDLELPPKSRIRCIFEIDKEDISRTEVNALSTLIHSKYHPISISINFKPKNKQTAGTFAIDSISNVKDYNVQKQFLQKWLKSNKVAEEYWDAIHELDSSVYEATSNLDLEDMSNTLWDLNYVEIENFMSYGKTVKISFDDYRGIVGLFGENAQGKSVIFQAILYALFNKTSCNVKNEKYINTKNGADFCRVKLSITIKGMNYIIERITKKMIRPRTGEISYRTDVDLSRKYIGSDECENLSEVQRKETEKVIRNAIGEYEDFLLTVLSTQDKDHEFISQRSSQQTDNMLRFLGLDVFLKKYEYVVKLLREVDNLRRINSTDDQSKALSAELEKIAEYKKRLKEVLAEKKSADDLADSIRETIASLQSAINGHKIIAESEEDLLISRDNITREIENTNKTIKEKEEKLVDIKAEIDALNAKVLDNATIEEFEGELSQYGEVQGDIIGLENEESTLRRVISIYEKELSKSTTCPVSYDENYTKCALFSATDSKRKELEKAKKELSEIQENIRNAKHRLDQFEPELCRSMIASNNENISALFKINRELEITESSILSLNQKNEVSSVSLSIVVGKLEDYAQNKDNIENNKKIRTRISKLELDLKEAISTQKKVLDKVIELKQKIAVSESKVADTRKKLDELLSNDQKYAVYKTYCDAMSREGIPFSVLKQYIPIINFEINKILSSIVDFGVYFKIEDNMVDIVMRGDEDDTRPVTMASGMERLVINFSIRQVLLMLSYLNKPSTWFIDEGFGVLDANNLYTVQKFFDHAKTVFKNIVIITHLDGMKDIADHTIVVSKVNGISQLQMK